MISYKNIWTMLSVVSCLIFATSLTSAQGYEGQFAWQTNNTNETTLTPQNVSSGQFGKIFSYPVDGSIFAQPLYVPNVAIPNQGTHNVVYVVTENDGVYAFDADGLSSAPLWYVSLINPAAGVTSAPCYQVLKACNIYPTIGITGTPAIDPVAGTMYFSAQTLENGSFVHRLHALNITNGTERPGSPVVIQGTVPGKGVESKQGMVAFDPAHEVQRPGVLLMNGVVYIAYGAIHGWIFGYNAQNLNQLYLLNLSPNSYSSNIWQTGEGLTTDGLGNFYFATDDAPFDANAGSKDDYGDTLLKLNASLQVVDYFTPMDQACRAAQDLDLGSAGPLIVPTQNGPHPDEIIIAGKGGTPCDLWSGGIYAAPIYVVDRDNMGQYNSAQDQVIQEVQGSPHGYWSNSAYWASPTTNYVYSAGVDAWGGSGDYLKMYSLINGLLSTTPVAQSTAVLPVGATPFVSANNTSNGIVWALERQQSLSTLPGTLPAVLLAYDATNVATQLYSSATAGTRDQAGLSTKFVVPTVANGRVYVGTQSELDAYGLLTATLAPSSLNFNLIAIGSVSASQTVTLTNVGSTSLGITSITVSGEFTQTHTCGTSLPPAGTCTVSVTFKPTTDGAQTGSLTVVDSGGTQFVSLSGTATPLKFTPASVNFGSVKVGTTSAPKSVTVANVGSTTLTITSVNIGGTNTGDFALTGNTCGSSLAAGANCKVTMTFTPTATGSRSGNVTIKDNDPVSSQKILLSGTGT